MVESDIPIGWPYNPTAWSERVPVTVLAAIGCGIATYLSLYQYQALPGMGVPGAGVSGVPGVWEPFFGNGSVVILHSKISDYLPVTDATLGAIVYFLDGVMSLVGGKARWRTMPWTVLVLAVLVIGSWLTSIGLLIVQPLIYHTWCTLCVGSAIVSLLMFGPVMNETLATLQYLRRVYDRNASFRETWRVLWGLPPITLR